MVEHVYAHQKDKPYYEVRTYTMEDGGHGGPLAAKRDKDYWLQGRYKTLEEAYLAAFADQAKTESRSYTDPTYDIVEILPIEKQVYRVGPASIKQLIDSQQMKMVEVEN